FVVLAIATAITGREVIWLVLLGGVVALLVKTKGSDAGVFACTALFPMMVGASNAAGHQLVLEILAFFSKAGLFVFGSGLAIVPFLYGGVVQQHHWLTDSQFLVAAAVALITAA